LEFSEALELHQSDITALSTLRRLSGLHLNNICVPSEVDLHPLAQKLTGLRHLSLVQNSKVAPLLTGDEALGVIGEFGGLEELDLQGRICGVGDLGLLSLRGLTRLRKLAIGWVSWQSQVSQVRQEQEVDVQGVLIAAGRFVYVVCVAMDHWIIPPLTSSCPPCQPTECRAAAFVRPTTPAQPNP